jgi:hypothetical protein
VIDSRPATSDPPSTLARAAALACLAIGVVWRWHHILFAHPLTDYVYSDMEVYFTAGTRFLDPRYQPTIADTLFPPGAGFFYALLHVIDPTWRFASFCMFVLSCTLPLLVAALARSLYGARAGLLSLAMASLYFPFIDFFAYFLAEGPFMVAGYSGLALVVATLHGRARSRPALAAATGFGLVLAAAIRVVALPWWLALVALCLVWRRRSGAPGLGAIAAAVLVGGLVLLLPLTLRCTRLDEGRLCLISTNGPMNVVLGHADDVWRVQWDDAQRNWHHEFTPSPSVQQGNHQELKLDFGVYDGPANLRVALAMARAHPLVFLARSVDQVYNLFGGSVPWPSGFTPYRRTSIVFEQLAVVFLFLPAFLRLARRARALARLDLSAAPELLLCLPLVCQMAVSFATLGEPRYRMALDGFILILAAVEILTWIGHAPSERALVAPAGAS